jgi:hypothetical protein
LEVREERVPARLVRRLVRLVVARGVRDVASSPAGADVRDHGTRRGNPGRDDVVLLAREVEEEREEPAHVERDEEERRPPGREGHGKETTAIGRTFHGENDS